MNKRHYVHRGTEPFYDPMTHLYDYQGEGAPAITECREYFEKRTFFQLDRFHAAWEIKEILKGNPRYKAVRKKLVQYDEGGVITELTSVAGRLETKGKKNI